VLVWAEAIGSIAGALVTCSLIPQLIRVYRLRSAREISTLFTTLLLVGITMWLVYGILLRLTPVTVWNGVSIILIALLLRAKLKYGR